jgi:hypothetical protein
MPTGPIDVVSRPTTSDYVWNAAALTRSSLLATSLGTFATVTAGLALVVAGDLLSIIVLLGGLSLLTGLFVVPFIWWPIHQRRDLVLAPVHVVADDQGITWETEASTARHDWTVFRRIRETSGAFLFDTGANVAMLLPKRGIPEADVERLRSLFVLRGVMPPKPSGLERLRPLVGVAVGLAAAVAVIAMPIVLGPP